MRENPSLPFTVKEYRLRLERVRAQMDALGIQLLITSAPENIYYLTGYDTMAYFVYQALLLPLHGEPALITRNLLELNVRATSWVEIWRGFADHEDPVQVTAQMVEEMGAGDKAVGIEKNSWYFSISLFDRLRDELPWAIFVDSSGLIEGLRLVKSEAEIGYIGGAARAAGEAMLAGLEAARPGATEGEIAGAVYSASIEAGSEYTGHPPLISSGLRTGVPFATWSGRRLAHGDLVFLEVGGCVRRYHAGIMRTAVIGEPSGEVMRMARASKAGLLAAIGATRPGATAAEVDAACREEIARCGYGHCFHHRTGYSFGIAYPPDWGEGRTLSIRPGNPRVLGPGMVLHIVPFLTAPEIGGVAMSETVLVTEEGSEVLTGVEQKLFVK